MRARRCLCALVSISVGIVCGEASNNNVPAGGATAATSSSSADPKQDFAPSQVKIEDHFNHPQRAHDRVSLANIQQCSAGREQPTLLQPNQTILHVHTSSIIIVIERSVLPVYEGLWC